MAISSIGVGSGLPLEELLSDLRRSENHALTAIQSRQVQAENRLSAYGTLKSALDSLNTAAEALTKTDTYGAMKASVTGDAYTASVTNQAIPGEYSIEVEQLATTQSIVTAGVADRTQAMGTGGTITFTLENGTKTLDLSETGTSLDDIVKAINADADLGFNATVINDGTAEAPNHRLMLVSRETGTAAAAISVTTDNAELQSQLFDNLQVQDATDAVFNVTGITITSQSNTLENAIEDGTLTLNSAGESGKLSVTTNADVTSKAVKDFVTAYNSLQNTIRNLTSYDVDNQRSSALTGDSLARRVQSDVRNAISFASSEGELRSLAQLGITTNPTTGNLDIDESKLADALKNNMGDIQNLLSGSTGLGKRVADVADLFTRPGGLIGTATDGINRTTSDLERQYEITLDRIDTRMENYRRQFTALDSLVAQMSSVSAYLTQQLSMLSNLGNDNK